MRNASMKVLKNLVCCAAFICLMFVLAMPAHAASKADELLQLVNAERAQAGVAPLSMGSSALNAAAQARAKELTVNYSYNRPQWQPRVHHPAGVRCGRCVCGRELLGSC